MLALKRKQEEQRAAAASGSPLSLENGVEFPRGLKPSKPGKKKRTTAELRIQKDLSMVEHDEAATISFPNLNDLTEFRLTVVPRRGPWREGEFEFVFTVPQSYPYSPPRVSCETKLYHPNVSFYAGRVCLGLRDWWKPEHNISTVIHGLVNMFYEPELDMLDIVVNKQAADLLRDNQEQFRRVVNLTRRMTKKDQIGHCILDVLPAEMLRNTADFLDEESLVKFFIAALGSVPHQYIYTSMSRRIVEERFTSLQELVRNPLPVVPPAKVPPIVPPSVIEFVGRYVSFVHREYADADAGDQGILRVIRYLSGPMAVLRYFRDTIASNTKQDILWPVWYGKLQFDLPELKAPASMIATPIWYPELIRRCRHAFANECQARSMFRESAMFESALTYRFERGFNFILATVTGITSKDCEALSSVEGSRFNPLYRMAVVPPIRARELLQHLATWRAGAAADQIVNTDLQIAQYERIVGNEGESSSQLFCLWEDRARDLASARSSCREFTDEVVGLLTTRKSILSIPFLSYLPVIDDSPVVEHAVPTEPPRLNSITSVTNLADSLAGINRAVSAPNLAGMTSMKKRNVSYSKIEFREYQRTLGDNPSVSSGPPVALDWEYSPNHLILNVDDFEEKKRSRSKVELFMPTSIREDIVREYCDVSRSQMNAVAKEINKTKRNRKATALSTDAQEKWTEMLQSASRKFKRILSFSK